MWIGTLFSTCTPYGWVHTNTHTLSATTLNRSRTAAYNSTNHSAATATATHTHTRQHHTLLPCVTQTHTDNTRADSDQPAHADTHCCWHMTNGRPGTRTHLVTCTAHATPNQCSGTCASGATGPHTLASHGHKQRAGQHAMAVCPSTTCPLACPHNQQSRSPACTYNSNTTSYNCVATSPGGRGLQATPPSAQQTHGPLTARMLGGAGGALCDAAVPFLPSDVRTTQVRHSPAGPPVQSNSKLPS